MTQATNTSLSTRRVPVPETVRDTPDARRAGYQTAVRLDGGPARTAEQWARRTLEGAPALVRRVLVLGWRLGFRLRLGPLRAPATVLGFYLTDDAAEAVTLAAGSPLIEFQHRFVVDGDAVTWVTLARPHTRAGRVLWRLTAPVHERSMPLLLRRAARRQG